jgi:transposase
MKKVGMDLGKNQSDVCIIDEEGVVVERFKVRTLRESLSKKFANKEQCEIAIESCRDTGWVHEHLTALGHEVVVVDTTRARAVGIGHGRRKTDRRDAEALARSLLAGVTPQAHVLSKESRELRDVLATREQLVRLRTRMVTMLRGQYQGKGFVIPSCKAKDFSGRLRSMDLPGLDAPHVQCALKVLDCVNTQLLAMKHHLEKLSDRYEAFDRLNSVPGVKLIVSLVFISALDDARRFNNAHEVQAYLGLVPSEYSTGGKRRVGSITRCGNSMARRMLLQAAGVMMRSRYTQQDPLVVWAKQVSGRRGKKKGRVALARRLAGVLWAMWMDGTYYDPKGLARESFKGLTRRARLAMAEARAMNKAVREAPTFV